MIKIVFISDTHNYHDKVKLPKGDILVHAGDFSGRGHPAEVFNFFNWLIEQSLKFKHILFIAGNHDLSFEYKPYWLLKAIEQLPENVYYLEDSEMIIEGIKFYGSPWQPEFHNWGFNLSRGKKLADKWNMIPVDTDILITHGPPSTILDYSIHGGINVGCNDLFNKVNEIKPKINVFGHIHEGYGYKETDNTLFINASICTLSYQPTNTPVVVKYSKEKIKFVM
jgi:Icc-related predicted phosphoesterase